MKKVCFIIIALAMNLTGISRADLVSERNPEQYVKIGVEKKGIYKITRSMLAKAGVKVSKLDPRTINISNRGKDIPIHIKGEKDGRFGKKDYIEFFGIYNEGETTTTDRYSDTNIYILTWGNQTPVRIEYRVQQPIDVKQLDRPLRKRNTFHRKIRFEENTSANWRFPHPLGENTDFAFWFWLDSKIRDFKTYFDLPGLVEDTSVLLKIKFYGITHPPAYPDHHVVVVLNGEQAGDVWWDGRVQFLYQTDEIPPTFFKESRNRLDLKIPGDIGQNVGKSGVTAMDQAFLDWFDIEYLSDNYVPDGYVEAEFSPLQGEGFVDLIEFKKFPTDNVEVYDVSHNKIIKPFVVPYTTENLETSYNIYFTEKIEAKTRYIVSSEERKLTPSSIQLLHATNLLAKQNRADFIIVTHKDFKKAAKKLAQWKLASGLETVVVDVEDLYNEFNHGIFHPAGIRNFLKYAYENWQEPAPKYVLLIGDTSWDIKNLGSGEYHVKTFVPTYYFQPKRLLEYAVDNWFVDFNEGDQYSPEMAIGRFPVETLEQAMHIVNKTIVHETGAATGDWQINSLIMTSQEDIYTRKGDKLGQETFPPYFNNTLVYKDHTKNPARKIIDQINEGVLFTVFLGHGGSDLWAGKMFFTTHLIKRLKNKGKYPVSLTATCYSGTFDNSAEIMGIGEELIRKPEAGSVAVLGTAWRSFFNSDFAFTKRLLENIFEEKHTRLGDAFVNAKREGRSSDTNRAYVILGDPTIEISLPKLGVDLYIGEELEIDKPYELIGIVSAAINGVARMELTDATGEVIFDKQVEVTDGTFIVDLFAPLIATSGEGTFSCFVWSNTGNYISGYTSLKLDLVYKNKT